MGRQTDADEMTEPPLSPQGGRPMAVGGFATAVSAPISADVKPASQLTGSTSPSSKHKLNLQTAPSADSMLDDSYLDMIPHTMSHEQMLIER